MSIFYFSSFFYLVVALTSCHCYVLPALISQKSRTFSSRLAYENTTATLSFKQSGLCDPTVVQYSGYIDVDTDEHYFFWFFESRQDPDNAPFTMWLNGGPGCSSMTGLFDEVGPCLVNDNGTEVGYREIGSWNRVSNMLFLDQPAGTGFSYGDRIVSTDAAKIRIYQFLQMFFEAFPKYQKQVFHLFGESYGGHYLPAVAEYILEMNRSPGLPANQYINLESVGIGNPITDVLVQDQYAEIMACHSSYGSVLSQEDCDEMKNNIPRCTELMQICDDTGTEQDCYKATTYCAKYVEDIYLRSGRDIYDIRALPTDKSGTDYPKFLNDPETRALIGGKARFHHCVTSIKNSFYKTGDYARNYAPTVGKLLDNGIKVLIFVGDADYRANWYGVHGWTQVVDFQASQDYRTQSFSPWVVGGVEAGQIKYGGNLTFIRVYEAGHKVPYYQPEACYQMFVNHLNGIPQ